MRRNINFILIEEQETVEPQMFVHFPREQMVADEHAGLMSWRDLDKYVAGP